MSEKRFVCIDVGYGDDWYITDNGKRLSDMEIVELLNEQQATIESERDLFEKYKASAIRDMRDYSDKIIEMQKKVDEQQATIQSLKEENEKLRNIHLSIDLTYSYGWGRYLADVRVIDDE